MDQKTLTRAATDFINIFAHTLEAESLTHFASALKKIRTTRIQRGPLPRCQHPALEHLDTLSREIENERILNTIQALDWGQVYEGGGIEKNLAEGMFAAQAAGTYGVFAADDVATGLFLLAPNVIYPLHTHKAREVYHCLAGEIEITHGIENKLIHLKANQSSETPSERLHTLRTGAKPVLLAYIWTGDLTAPTWWWDKDKNGDWLRTSWHRKPGESWKPGTTEPVDLALEGLDTNEDS